MSKIRRFSLLGLRALNQQRSNLSSRDFSYYWSRNAEWHDCRRINILIGPNGAGKSTVLELLHSVAAPERLATIARENRPFDSPAVFLIEFDNHIRIEGRVEPTGCSQLARARNVKNSIDEQYLTIRYITVDEKWRPDRKLKTFAKNVSKIEIDADTHAHLLFYGKVTECDMQYWTYSETIEANDAIHVLNEAGRHLTGLISENGVVDQDGNNDDPFFKLRQTKPTVSLEGEVDRIGLWLAYDQCQYSNVVVRTLPRGWKQLISIVSWLKSLPLGSVAFIDEPETHLHPRLQRYLLRQINTIASEKQLQVFIATQSPIFQQQSAWKGNEDDLVIFEATGSKLSAQPSTWRILESLGVRNSDISQSNGIIWVEGPSDRIYIKHWLELYCKEKQVPVPAENVEYSFSYYGGAILSHYSIEVNEDFISLLRINRRVAIVMDRDNHFCYDVNGQIQCTNMRSAKFRILEELRHFGQPNAMSWVTYGYTIESYLPESFLQKNFTPVGSGLAPNCGNKVIAARAYAEQFKSFPECVQHAQHLRQHIENLFQTIQSWNN